jgi:hypothetical protein
MRFFDGNGAGLTLSAPVDSQSGGPAIPRQPAHRTNPQAEPAPAAFLESCRATGAAGLRSRAFVLPDALTPAVNRPVVAIRAGKRAVSHSHSRIRFAIAHGLIARVNPTEVLRRQGAADAGGRPIITVATATISFITVPPEGLRPNWKVSVGLRRILKPNKINHFGMSADHSVQPQEKLQNRLHQFNSGRGLHQNQ